MNLTDVERAAERIRPHVHRTPLLTTRTLSEWIGGELRLKAECLQRAGAFKIRGAMNKVLALDPEARKRGLVAFSSGNHAQAVALAARLMGTRATIVMPADAMAHKVAATRGYGADVVQDNVTAASRSEVAWEIAARTGAVMVPPFDDPDIIAGQGTVGLEILEDWPDVETVVVPTGGGGLLSGIALALSRKPGVRVIGVEPAAGNDVQRSLATGAIVTIEPPATIADGARTIAVGRVPFEIIRERVAEIVTVEDDALLDAMRHLALRSKVVVEPTGALAVAALLGGKIKDPGRAVAVLSGGNVAPAVMSQAMLRPD